MEKAKRAMHIASSFELTISGVARKYFSDSTSIALPEPDIIQAEGECVFVFSWSKKLKIEDRLQQELATMYRSYLIHNYLLSVRREKIDVKAMKKGLSLIEKLNGWIDEHSKSDIYNIGGLDQLQEALGESHFDLSSMINFGKAPEKGPPPEPATYLVHDLLRVQLDNEQKLNNGQIVQFLVAMLIWRPSDYAEGSTAEGIVADYTENNSSRISELKKTPPRKSIDTLEIAKFY